MSRFLITVNFTLLWRHESDQLSDEKPCYHDRNHKISVKRGCSLDKLAVHMIDMRKLIFHVVNGQIEKWLS